MFSDLVSVHASHIGLACLNPAWSITRMGVRFNRGQLVSAVQVNIIPLASAGTIETRVFHASKLLQTISGDWQAN